MYKKYSLFFIVCFTGFGVLAQRPNIDPDRFKNSIFFGVSGGLNIPVKTLAETNSLGYNAQADLRFFLRHNISVDIDYAYNHFPHNESSQYKYVLHEVLIGGSFYFKSSWRPNISAGFGYFGNNQEGRFGFVLGAGIMKKLHERIYFTAKPSWILMDNTTFFKINAGLTFKIVSPPPPSKPIYYNRPQ
ncbi:MAG: porin family protein [Bacteroidales bacterium]|jgi:opacity protein-like surface antigen|nr:porin family protein [Bacteroidales bacterium]